MVNPLDHWLRVLFCTRSWIPLRGFPGSWGIGFRIPLRGLSGFWVPPRLVVPTHPLRVPVRWSFEFSLSFSCSDIYGPHCSMVLYRVVFCDIVFSLIKSHVYCSRSFLLRRSVDYYFCRCSVRYHRCGWLYLDHIF